LRARAATLENNELVAKSKNLRGQLGSGTEGRPGGGDEGNKEREHPAIEAEPRIRVGLLASHRL
jgi:hypothetical protein